MHNIFTELSNYNNSQKAYLKELTDDKLKYSFEMKYYDNLWENEQKLRILSLPISELNKDKILAISSATCHIFTGDTYEGTLNGLIRRDLFVPNVTVSIAILGVSRGITFIDTYLKNEDWEYLDKISLYLQLTTHHKVKAYKNAEKIFIYTNHENTEFTLRLLSALPLLLKENFTFTEETINIYRSLQEDATGKKMVQLVNEFIIKNKLLEKQKLNELTKAIDILTKAEYNRLQKEINDQQIQIEHTERNLLMYYNRLRDLQSQESFYKPSINTEELAQYILSNPNIVDFKITNSAMLLAIEAPLEYIEVPALKKLINNAASFIWPRWNEVPKSIARHPMKFIQMLSDLFLKDRYTIYTRSEIVLDFDQKEAYPFRKIRNRTSSDLLTALLDVYPSDWNIEERLKTDRAITPHMHIEFFDCWSGNKTNIAKCLQKSDIIGALDICVNTTKDINVTDSTVFNRFIQSGLWAPRPPELTSYYYNERPDLLFKTIYDKERKCFRTFGDIFYNDYVKEDIHQYDIAEDFSDII